MKPWEKEKLARSVIEELAKHEDGAWFTPEAIVQLEQFDCEEDMVLEVYADLVKRDMLVPAHFSGYDQRNSQAKKVLVSAWKVNSDKKTEIKEFIDNGDLWHMYVTPTIKWFWGISAYRILVILTFAIAAFAGGFLSEAGKSIWDLVEFWDEPASKKTE